MHKHLVRDSNTGIVHHTKTIYHTKENHTEIIYQTKKIRFIYFSPDVLYLMKTLRNQLFHFGFGIGARYMWSNDLFLYGHI